MHVGLVYGSSKFKCCQEKALNQVLHALNIYSTIKDDKPGRIEVDVRLLGRGGVVGVSLGGVACSVASACACMWRRLALPHEYPL